MFYLIDRSIAGHGGRDGIPGVQKEGGGQGLAIDPNTNHWTL